MRKFTLLLFLLTALCLVSCTVEKEYTYDEINDIFETEFRHFETAAGILSGNPELRDHLRDEVYVELVYSMGRLSHKDEVFLKFISSEDIKLLDNSIEYISPAYVAYTQLNMYDKSGNTYPVEAVEFGFNLTDEKYPDPSVCSIFYVPSPEDRAFIEENPYRFYGGTTVRLQFLEHNGWYLFLFY